MFGGELMPVLVLVRQVRLPPGVVGRVGTFSTFRATSSSSGERSRVPCYTTKLVT